MHNGDQAREHLEALVRERQVQVSEQEQRVQALSRRQANTEAAELALFALRRNLRRAEEDLHAATGHQH